MGDCGPHVVRVDRVSSEQPRDAVAAGDLCLERLFQRPRGPARDLRGLGGFGADEQARVRVDVSNNGFVELVAADLGSRGIVLAGGGALLRGLDQLLSSETGLPVVVAEKPLECVVLGAGSSLEESELLGRTSKKRQPFGRRRRRR